VGALSNPHSSLPVGVFTSSFLVNVNLPRGAPPFFSGPSRPSGLSLSRRFHSTVSRKPAGPRNEHGKAGPPRADRGVHFQVRRRECPGVKPAARRSYLERH